MDDVLDESVSEEDLRVGTTVNCQFDNMLTTFEKIFWQKFERRYHDSLAQGTVTHGTQFEYAWCLIRSKYQTDIKRGIFLLEDLSKGGNDAGRRDCIYYLAIGNAKIKVINVYITSFTGTWNKCFSLICRNTARPWVTPRFCSK